LSIISEIQGLHSTEERAKAPIVMPISTLDPPRAETNKGKRKKQPKLDTVKKLASAIRIKEEEYSIKFTFKNQTPLKGFRGALELFATLNASRQ